MHSSFDTKEKMDQSARHALSAIFTGDELTTHLVILRRYNRVKPINEVKMKRSIAENLLSITTLNIKLKTFKIEKFLLMSMIIPPSIDNTKEEGIYLS
ncbi:hypothetical protein [Shimazuella soli]|uniref:hypothetical protein n=1 Tax=Shimazuella soli TaxID=1892854 RepID=UPI001F0F6486|nr:hypothetical protein [Shimazuella soli]